MDGVNYLLLFQGNSDKGGHEASVRGFTKPEAAHAAMVKAYGKLATALNIPVGSRDRYTTKTENRLRLERYGGVFQWEIIEAVPEDGATSEPHRERRGAVGKYTVTIEEHIAQDFPVEGRDIFDALRSAEDAYKRGELVVQPAAPNARLIMARDAETSEVTEWKEF